MTEAEIAMEEKLRKKKEEDEAMWQEYIEQWRKQRAKEEEELRKLKERQAKRKVTRAEQEKRLMELKRKQEAQRMREQEEKKQKEAEAKRKRLEEAEKKRQAMLEEQRKLKEGKPNFVIQKKETGGPSIHPSAFEKMSNIDQARSEMSKSKEQLAEDKQIALTYRIKPLNIEGLGAGKLREVAEELWTKIVTLESEKYDLEEKMKRQDYDLRELTERQKQINRQKALKKGIDPAEAEGKHPPKILVASKYERTVDRRPFTDKKSLFEGGLDDIVKEQIEKSWKERMETWKERGPKQLPKWDPTAPKVKEVIEHRNYEEEDDLLDIEPPGFGGVDLEPEPEPSPPRQEEPEEEEEEEEEEEDEEEEEEEEE